MQKSICVTSTRRPMPRLLWSSPHTWRPRLVLTTVVEPLGSPYATVGAFGPGVARGATADALGRPGTAGGSDIDVARCPVLVVPAGAGET